MDPSISLPPGGIDLSGEPAAPPQANAPWARSSSRPRSSRSLISALILYSLFSNGWEFFTRRRVVPRLRQRRAGTPGRTGSSITTLLVGSLIVTGIAMLVAAPLGLGAAIYLSEYARPRVRSIAQADHRGAGRHPVGGASACSPSTGSPPSWSAPSSARTTTRGSMLAAGIGVGHPRHPAGGLGVGGRHAGRAQLPAPGVGRPRRPPHGHHRAGRVARGGVGHRRRLHPRRLPGHRRDDGRLHRRRRRRLGPTSRPTRSTAR